jgi:hypothetical protein
VNVLDRYLQIVGDLGGQALRKALVFLLFLLAHASLATLFQQLGVLQLLHLKPLFPALLLILIVFGLLFGARQQIHVFDKDFDRGAPNVGPGDDKRQLTQVSFDDIDGQLELVESFSAELEIPQFDVAGPDANLELCGVEVLDVHAQEAVEQAGDKSFQHLAGILCRNPGRGYGGWREFVGRRPTGRTLAVVGDGGSAQRVLAGRFASSRPRSDACELLLCEFSSNSE